MKTNDKATSQTSPPRKKRHGKRAKHTPSLNLPKPRADVAGADIGAREIALCVPEGSDPKPVRIFATFTADLGEAIQWLKQCDRGRDGDATPRPSLQTGRADFPHPAFQLVWSSLSRLG